MRIDKGAKIGKNWSFAWADGKVKWALIKAGIRISVFRQKSTLFSLLLTQNEQFGALTADPGLTRSRRVDDVTCGNFPNFTKTRENQAKSGFK